MFDSLACVWSDSRSLEGVKFVQFCARNNSNPNPNRMLRYACFARSACSSGPRQSLWAYRRSTLVVDAIGWRFVVRVRVGVASQRSYDVRGRDVKNMQESCPKADFKVGNEIYGVELP